MRGAAETMVVVRPNTTQEALEAFAEAPHALPFVGGTDLMVLWNQGELNGRHILDLSRLEDWSRIEASETSLRLGALATHTQIQQHPVAQQRFPLLVQACATVGGVQIQNRGTIGGNIANASPAGDTLPPLAVYNALVHVASVSGRRTVPFLDIFAGVKRTTLRPGELIEAIEMPFAEVEPRRAVFRKVGTRAAQAISKTVAAALLWFAPDDTVADVRIALGSMAPTVRRLKSLEAALKGQTLTPDIISKAGALVSQDVSPIDDVRSTAAYRLGTSQRLIEAFLAGTL